jgi:hypothetical protein
MVASIAVSTSARQHVINTRSRVRGESPSRGEEAGLPKEATSMLIFKM